MNHLADGLRGQTYMDLADDLREHGRRPYGGMPAPRRERRELDSYGDMELIYVARRFGAAGLCAWHMFAEYERRMRRAR